MTIGALCAAVAGCDSWIQSGRYLVTGNMVQIVNSDDIVRVEYFGRAANEKSRSLLLRIDIQIDCAGLHEFSRKGQHSGVLSREYILIGCGGNTQQKITIEWDRGHSGRSVERVLVNNLPIGFVVGDTVTVVLSDSGEVTVQSIACPTK